MENAEDMTVMEGGDRVADDRNRMLQPAAL